MLFKLLLKTVELELQYKDTLAASILYLLYGGTTVFRLFRRALELLGRVCVCVYYLCTIYLYYISSDVINPIYLPYGLP